MERRVLNFRPKVTPTADRIDHSRKLVGKVIPDNTWAVGRYTELLAG
jgi:hypothetical protein